MTEIDIETIATSLQLTYFKAYQEHNCYKKAAESLGVSEDAIRSGLSRLRARVTASFYGPGDTSRPVPAGFEVSKATIVEDADGNTEKVFHTLKPRSADVNPSETLPDPKTVKRMTVATNSLGEVAYTWTRYEPKAQERAALWEGFAKELAASVPRASPIPQPDTHEDHLMVAYPIGDHHLGMFAWDGESGQTHSTERGVWLLEAATDYLIEHSPTAHTGLIVGLGDFFHFDGVSPVTPTSGHVLDADARFTQLIKLGANLWRNMVEKALKKHAHVHVIVAPGNHDLASAVWITTLLAALYENDPRVTIETECKHFLYYQFGKVLIGVHHGHGPKLNDLPAVMANDVPKAWGDTEARYIWTGHVHHKQIVKDLTGVEVESFRILPPEDAYAYNRGYRSKRDMQAIVMHREYGELRRLRVPSKLLTDAAGRA